MILALTELTGEFDKGFKHIRHNLSSQVKKQLNVECRTIECRQIPTFHVQPIKKVLPNS
jgi:hypothetical protein